MDFFGGGAIQIIALNFPLLLKQKEIGFRQWLTRILRYYRALCWMVISPFILKSCPADIVFLAVRRDAHT